MANTAESGFSPVRQFDPYTRPRLARWPIPGRLSQCLLQPVHVWLTAKLGADVPAETSSGRCCMGAAPNLVCTGAGCFSTGAVVERRITSSLSDFGKHPARCLLLRDSRLPAPSRYLLSGINLVLIHRRAGKRASRRCALAGNRHRWSYRYCPLTLGSESGTIGIEPPTSAFFPYSARVLVFPKSHRVRVPQMGSFRKIMPPPLCTCGETFPRPSPVG